MGNPEESTYRQHEGKCRQCGKEHTYYDSVKRHPDHDICRECEEANKHPLSDQGVYRLLQKLEAMDFSDTAETIGVLINDALEEVKEEKKG